LERDLREKEEALIFGQPRQDQVFSHAQLVPGIHIFAVHMNNEEMDGRDEVRP
jgi:hypothetical protein